MRYGDSIYSLGREGFTKKQERKMVLAYCKIMIVYTIIEFKKEAILKIRKKSQILESEKATACPEKATACPGKMNRGEYINSDSYVNAGTTA